MPRVGSRRLFVFLALSIALHAFWLALPVQTGTRVRAMASEPLDIRLVLSPPTEKSAVVVRHHPRGESASATHSPALAAEASPVANVPSPATINLDAAFATARSQALLPQPRASLDAPKPLLTVEAAVARATRPDVPVETRGAGGEYVTITGKTRCVTPLVVPHFLEGKTMLTQCEIRRG